MASRMEGCMARTSIGVDACCLRMGGAADVLVGDFGVARDGPILAGVDLGVRCLGVRRVDDGLRLGAGSAGRT